MKPTPRRRTGVGSALVALAAACGDTTGPPTPAPPPAARHAARLVPASPTAVHARPGSFVPAPAVVVLDQYGSPLSNVTVQFTPIQGSSYVEHRIAATQSGGRATAGAWGIGPLPDENIVLAWISDDVLPIAFIAVGGTDSVRATWGLVRVHPDYITTEGPIGGAYILREDGTFTSTRVLAGQTPAVNHSTGTHTRTGSVIAFSDGAATWPGFVRDDTLRFVPRSDTNPGIDSDVVEVYALAPIVTGAFPAIAAPAVVYDRTEPHRYPANVHSRYVLYDDTTFGLQYLGFAQGFFEYRGRFVRADSAIRFDFNDGNTAGPWQAGGVVRGDSLIVSYNMVMWLADFEDGTYVRSWSASSQAKEMQP